MRKILMLVALALVLPLAACGGSSGPDRSIYSSYYDEYCYYFPLDCYGGNIYFNHPFHSHYGFSRPSVHVYHHYTPRPKTYYVRKTQQVKAQKVQQAKQKVAKQKAQALRQRSSSRSSSSRPSFRSSPRSSSFRR
jgi:hypothetical protein